MVVAASLPYVATRLRYGGEIDRNDQIVWKVTVKSDCLSIQLLSMNSRHQAEVLL
jgi:hypothetical protein